MAETLAFSSLPNDPKEREALAEQIAERVRGLRLEREAGRMVRDGKRNAKRWD